MGGPRLAGRNTLDMTFTAFMPRGDGGERMHEPGDNSPASNEPQDWTNSYQPVQVDVDGLLGYYETMMMKVLPAVAGPTATVLAPMGQFISEGLMGQGGSSDATAGTFPEGIVVAQLMSDYQTKFTDFFKDVQTGI